MVGLWDEDIMELKQIRKFKYLEGIDLNTQTIRDLEKRLWDTADELRANTGLKASEYSTPILGLIFLKFADSKYHTYEEEIKKEYQELKGGRREKAIEEIAIEKCGFYLPGLAIFYGGHARRLYTHAAESH